MLRPPTAWSVRAYSCSLPALGSIVKLDRSLDRLPRGVTACHVTCVEAGLAQLRSGGASHIKPVRAENHPRLGIRELAHPFIEAFRVRPNRSDHDVLTPGEVVR